MPSFLIIREQLRRQILPLGTIQLKEINKELYCIMIFFFFLAFVHMMSYLCPLYKLENIYTELGTILTGLFVLTMAIYLNA